MNLQNQQGIGECIFEVLDYYDPIILMSELEISCLDCSPQYIVYATPKSIKVYDLYSDKQLGSDFHHNTQIMCIRISSDGLLFASADLDGYLNIFETMTQQVIQSLKPSKCLRVIRFSPCDRQIASGCDDKHIRIWNISLSKQDGRLMFHRNQKVVYLAYSIDGNYLFSAGRDANIRIWDLRTRLCCVLFNGRIIQYGVKVLNNNLIATSYLDSLILWDLKKLKKIRKLTNCKYIYMTILTFLQINN